MLMTSVAGHIMELDFNEPYNKWNSCHPSQLFSAPVSKHVNPNLENIAKTLKREIKGCEGLILWTDCDREGENIAYEIIDLCKTVKRSIKVYRARFAALIPRDIHYSVNHLQNPNMNESLCVDSRQEIDLRIGSVFTRFQTFLLQNKYDGLPENVISYGPCQFPTLGFVVERFLQIKNFISEDFYSIKVIDKKDNNDITFRWKRQHIFDHIIAFILYEKCVKNPLATVVGVEGKQIQKYRPFPLTTVEMQKRCARYLHISSDKVMKITESLYEKGYISYPRTETDMFVEGFDIQSLLKEQIDHPKWANQLMNGIGFENPKKGKHTDNAHTPIHPTKSIQSANLSNDDLRVYEFIVRHFLACCSKNAIGYETNITISIDEEFFITTGLLVKEKNYLEIYTYEKWSENEIPNYNEGDTFIPSQLSLETGKTEPPRLISEPELINKMDKEGIGTDATIAEHIETIQKRGYVEKIQGDLFTPTTLGLSLILGYMAMGYDLDKPRIRAKIESHCVCVSNGEMTKDQVVNECILEMKQIFEGVQNKQNLLEDAVSQHFNRVNGNSNGNNNGNNFGNFSFTPIMKCPKCNNNSNAMVLKKIKDQFVISCNGYPLCKNSIWVGSLVKSIEVTSTKLSQNNDVFLLKFEFDPRHLPLHILESTYIGCVGGHDRILSEIGININYVIPQPPPNAVRNNNTNTSNNNNNNNNNSVIIEDDDLADIDFDEELLNLEIENNQPQPQHQNNNFQPPPPVSIQQQYPPHPLKSSTTITPTINQYFSQEKKTNTPATTSFNYSYQDNNAYIPTPPDDFDETLSPILDSYPPPQSVIEPNINIKNLCEDIKTLYETIPNNQNKNQMYQELQNLINKYKPH